MVDFHWTGLVDFDDAVNFSHKEEASEEAHSTSKEEENQDHDKCVAKVQKGRGCSSDCQFSDKEMNRVQEEIHCSTTTSQE